jgi:hypothetical protein
MEVTRGNYGMGHFPDFYIIVPEENLTEDQWAATTRLFKLVKGAEVKEFKTETPDEPIEIDSEGRFSYGEDDWMDIFFSSFTEDDLMENIQWPIPKGMAMIHGRIDIKWAPNDREEAGVIMSAMRTIFSGMGGVYANVANELHYETVTTFEEFMKSHDGYLILSKDLADMIGMERFEKAGIVTDFGEGVELRTYHEWVPEFTYSEEVMKSRAIVDGIIDELLENVDILECEGPLHPDFDISDIGTTLEPRFPPGRELGYRRGYVPPTQEIAGGVQPMEVTEWARQVADDAIMKRDKGAIDVLDRKSFDTTRAGELGVTRDILRHELRLKWSLYGGIGRESVETCIRLADVLIELGEYKEAEMLMRTVTEYQHNEGDNLSPRAIRHYGISLHRQGQLEDAARLDEWGMQTIYPEFDFMNFQAGHMLTDMALVYIEMGELEKASAALGRSKSIAAFTKNEEPGVMRKWLGAEALVAKERGDLERAVDVAMRGVNFAWSSAHVHGRDMEFNISVLSEVLEAKGDTEGAMRARHQALAFSEGMTKKEYLDQYGTASLQ